MTKELDPLRNRWAVLTLEDGMIFEGTIDRHESYGVFFCIGGSLDRLALYPWDKVARILYRPE